LAHHSAADMSWPIQLCVGNVINELLFDYQFPVDDCAKFVAFKNVLDRLFFQIRTRRSALLVQAYPWLVNVPVLGHHGYWELRNDILKVVNFMTEEIIAQKKTIDYDADSTSFLHAYLKEIKRREKKGDMGSFS
jgi:hypothetical protein